MLEEIKKIQGINHNEFDNIINDYIDSCKKDLKSIGIVDTLFENDKLVQTAIKTYVLSFLDVNNAEMYSNSYRLQKNQLRNYVEYTVKGK